ncbi:hypothetical protein ACHHYP_07097 [Achlya hypogyna]|uniref:B30.2/SPRY domain-containing protein n=1 Tax=Achlya hypogyna TaxID=1202772 RepID=A0A1V9ZMR2_ACHHY|nr:hypothetical protein ACHHYP_07097 [Achlya hypogyna]
MAFEFDPTAHGSALRVTDDGNCVTCVATADGRCHMAVAATPFGPATTVHIEILRSFEGIAVGVVHGKIRRGVGIGRTRDCGGHGWGLAANGDLCHAGDTTPSHLAFAAGDVLSMVFDPDDSGPAGPGTLTFYRHRAHGGTVLLRAFSGLCANAVELYPAVHLQHAGESARFVEDRDFDLQPAHELQSAPDAIVDPPDFANNTTLTLPVLCSLWNASRSKALHEPMCGVLPSLLTDLADFVDDALDMALAIVCQIVSRTPLPPLPPLTLELMLSLLPRTPHSTTLPWVLLALEPLFPANLDLAPLFHALYTSSDARAQRPLIGLLLRVTRRAPAVPRPLTHPKDAPADPELRVLWLWLVHQGEGTAADHAVVAALALQDAVWVADCADTLTARLPHTALPDAATAVYRAALYVLAADPSPPAALEENASPEPSVRERWVAIATAVTTPPPKPALAHHTAAMGRLRQEMGTHRLLLQELVTERRQWTLPVDEAPVVFAEEPLVAALLAQRALLVPVLRHAGYLGPLAMPVPLLQAMATTVVSVVWAAANCAPRARARVVAELLVATGAESAFGEALLAAFLATADDAHDFWRVELQSLVDWFLTSQVLPANDVILEYIAYDVALRVTRAMEARDSAMRTLLAALAADGADVGVVVTAWLRRSLAAPEWLVAEAAYSPAQIARVQGLLRAMLASDHWATALCDAALAATLADATDATDDADDSDDDTPRFFALFAVEAAQLLHAAATALRTGPRTKPWHRELRRILASPLGPGPPIDAVVHGTPLALTLVAAVAPVPAPRQLAAPVDAVVAQSLELLHIRGVAPAVAALAGRLPPEAPLDALWTRLLDSSTDARVCGRVCRLQDLGRCAGLTVGVWSTLLDEATAWQAGWVAQLGARARAATDVVASVGLMNARWLGRLEASQQFHFVQLPVVADVAASARAALRAVESQPCQCRVGLNAYDACNICLAHREVLRVNLDGAWLGVQLHQSHAMNTAFRTLLAERQALARQFVELLPPERLSPPARGWHDHVLFARLHATESPKWRRWLQVAVYLACRPLLFPSLAQDARLYDQLVQLALLLPSDVGVAADVATLAHWTQQLQRAVAPGLLPSTALRRLAAFARAAPRDLLSYCLVKARPRTLFSVVRAAFEWTAAPSFAAFAAAEGLHPLLVAGHLAFAGPRGEWTVRLHERLQRHVPIRALTDEILRACPPRRLSALLDVAATLRDRLALHDQAAVVASEAVGAAVPVLPLALHCDGDLALVRGVVDDLGLLSAPQLARLLRLLARDTFLWPLATAVVAELAARPDATAVPGLACALRHLRCVEALGFASGLDVAAPCTKLPPLLARVAQIE